MKSRLLFAAKIASSFYRSWISSPGIVESYGKFWDKYWKHKQHIFSNPEFYTSFFDWERWDIKEFYNHNNPFNIDFSTGNLQVLDTLLRVVKQIDFYASNIPGDKSQSILFSIFALLAKLPQHLPGDPNYEQRFNDTLLHIVHRDSRTHQLDATFCQRSLYSANQALFTNYALNKCLGFADARATRNLILEVGGGYGSLANLICLLNRQTDIILLDLVEAASLQVFFCLSMQEYVSSRVKVMLPESLEPVEVTYDNTKSASDSTITIVPSLLTNHSYIVEKSLVADCFLNFDSFMEMPYAEINKYFSLLCTMKPGSIFVSRNRYRKISELSKYPFDDNWTFLYSHANLLMPWHHDLVLRREADPCQFLVKFRKRIHEYDCSWHNKPNCIADIAINDLRPI